MTLYQKTLADFQENYLGYIPLLIIGQSCIGSAAVIYIMQNDSSPFQMVELGIIVLVCMLANVSVLSQQTPKFVFNFTLFTVMLCTAMIILNTIFA